jgi:photosystem II stability/assembly factor-like uncharacterized protein
MISKKKITALLLFILSFNTIIFAQWRTSTPYAGTLQDIVFVDRQTGYACGQAAGVGTCVSTASILKTMDAGKNWTRMNTGTSVQMNKMFFLDAYTGWAIGASSTVIKTTDGGVNWSTQTTGIGSGLNDIHFPTATTGFVVGPSGALRKSINGGSSWTTIASGVTTTLNGVYFVNANTGFIVGASGVVKKTTNGGTSWTTVFSGTDYFKSVYFSDANHGIIMTPYKFYITENGGSTWTSIDGDPSWLILKMKFVTPEIGFAVSDPGLLLKTTDGGYTWSTAALDPSASWLSLSFIDDQNGWVCGNIAQIDKTTDGGSTWTNCNIGLSTRILSLHFKNRTTGLMVGYNGKLYRTENAGLTFTKQPTGVDETLLSVQWIDDMQALAVGDSGTILKTYDAGISWSKIQHNFNYVMDDIWVVDSLYAYIAMTNGRVLKTTDAGETWTYQTTTSTIPFTCIHMLNREVGMVAGNNEVYKTTDGGLSWVPMNTGILLNTGIEDVWMIDENIAYVGSGFGKVHKTLNGGTLWEGIYPTSNTNAEIDQMQFFSENEAFFSRFNSQSRTIDGCINIGSESTACLANNGGMNTIHLPEYGWGFAGGGLQGVFHTLQQSTIYNCRLQDTSYCSGGKILVGFNATGLMLSTHVFTAQLSDANGSFANPTNIGTYTLMMPTAMASGVITCTLPTMANGTHYRVRVICDNPAMTSPDNGYDVRIINSHAPSLTLMVNENGDCNEKNYSVQAIPQNGGIFPIYTWQINGQTQNGFSPMYNYSNVQDTVQLTVSMNSSLLCVSSDNPTASVTLLPGTGNPNVQLGEDMAVCFNSYIVLENNTPGSPEWTINGELYSNTANSIEWMATQDAEITLTITDSYGCQGSDTLAVIAQSLPTADWSIDDVFCADDSTVFSIDLDSTASITGFSIPDIVSLAPTQYLIPNPMSGILIAYLTDNNNCSNSDTTAFSISDQPSLDLSVYSIPCEGDSAILMLSTDQNIIQWSENNIDSIGNQLYAFPLTDSLTITATVTNSDGCIQSQSIFVDPFAIPTLILPESVSLCLGDTASFVIPNNNLNLTWEDNPSIASMDSIAFDVFPIEDTNFTILASDSNGCFTLATIFLDVLPLPETPILELNINVLYFINNNSLWVDWYMNGDLLLSSIVDSFEVNTNGNYQVIVTNDNGCSATSDIFIVELVNIAETDATQIEWMYNNHQLIPSVTISSPVNIVLLDNSGKRVCEINQGQSPIALPIDLSTGIYILHYHGKGLEGVTKLFIP